MSYSVLYILIYNVMLMTESKMNECTEVLNPRQGFTRAIETLTCNAKYTEDSERQRLKRSFLPCIVSYSLSFFRILRRLCC